METNVHCRLIRPRRIGVILGFGIWSALGGLVFLLTPASALAQGSLTPPGPPAPTMKSLDQIQPRTPISSVPYMISSAGSYYLTNNVTVTSGDAITINASNVALDLNGFTISSTAPSAAGTAILIGNNLSNIAIHNGFIQSGVLPNGNTYTGSGFANGVDLVNITPGNVHISNLFVNGVLNDGIVVGGGNASFIEGCTVQVAGGRGLWASVVRGSVANYCGISGIIADEVHDSHAHTTLSGSTALSARYTAHNSLGYNTSDGYGISAYVAQNCYGYSVNGVAMATYSSENCYAVTGNNMALDVNIVSNCYALNNSATIPTINGGNSVRGTYANNGAAGPVIASDAVADCVAVSNGGANVNIIQATNVSNSRAIGTTTAGAKGILADVVENCRASVTGANSYAIYSNGSVLNSEGIVTAGAGSGIVGNVISNCYATSGANGTGLSGASAGAKIMDSNAFVPSGIGIAAGASTMVRNCVVTVSTTGITAVSSCLIEGNTLDGNTNGIVVSGSGNRIDGNRVTCAGPGNAAFVINGTNNLIVRNSARANGTTNQFTINGSANSYGSILNVSAGGQLPTNDPWANFIY